VFHCIQFIQKKDTTIRNPESLCQDFFHTLHNFHKKKKVAKKKNTAAATDTLTITVFLATDKL